MRGVSVITILNLILYCQTSNGQQNGVASNCQQTVQNNAGFSQAADPANLNIQMQQSAKQAPSSQQSYNLQQLANIPMQTFNVQQPVNFQQQANSPPVNFQPVNQANGLQQVPQSINLQDVKQQDSQQILSNPANIQHAPVIQQVCPQQTSNAKAVPSSMIIQQQAHPNQASHFQQQAYPVNIQQQPIQTPNFNQPQTSQQCVNLQKSVVVQPGNSHQQTVVNNGNIQQVPPHQANFQQPSQPYINVPQQTAVQQPSVIVQPVTTYQQPMTIHEPIVKQLNIQKCTQDPHNVHQMQVQQMDPQQKQVPCQNVGGYQVVAYQKPCQQQDVAAALPMSVQFSKVSTNPYPTVIAAVPAAIPDSSKIVQRVDHMYLVSPQNYVNSPQYSGQTALVTNNMQQVLTGPNTTPTVALPNSNTATAVNFVVTGPNQCAETIDDRLAPMKTSDLGILSILQGELPVASLLNQPSSSFESALLSSILSSIQNPSSSSSQYVIANYPPQTVFNSQSNSQNSKFSLKSLLPLLLNLLEEKYSGCGCKCQCCNCERTQNDNNVHESQNLDDNKEVHENRRTIEETETREEPSEDDEVSLEEEDIPLNPRHREKSKYQNMISDDSEEIDETQNSSIGIDTEDIGTGSGDEEDVTNDSNKL